MSYYPPQPGTQASMPTTATYAYGAYHPSPYSYQAPGAYQWPYPYGYSLQPQQTPVRTVQPATQTPAPAQTPASIPTAPAAPRPVTTYTSYTPSYARDNAASTANRGSRKQSNIKGLFTKELRSLMYGFGDDRNPANDTVNVMEEILVEYITDVCQAAGGPGRKTRLSIEDLRKVLSRPADAKKLARMEELLFAQEDIKRARQQFDTDPKMV